MIYRGKNINISQLVLTILIFVYLIYYLMTINDWHFIDNINLIFHEAGHVVFGLLGGIIAPLGGTLMQILIPLLLVFYFYKKNENYSAAILLYWLGQNLFNISVYLGDAIKMELPLLGGDGVEHDWNFILSELNLLKYTNSISSAVCFLGIIVLIFAFIYSIKFSIKDNQNV